MSKYKKGYSENYNLVQLKYVINSRCDGTILSNSEEVRSAIHIQISVSPIDGRVELINRLMRKKCILDKLVKKA